MLLSSALAELPFCFCDIVFDPQGDVFKYLVYIIPESALCQCLLGGKIVVGRLGVLIVSSFEATRQHFACHRRKKTRWKGKDDCSALRFWFASHRDRAAHHWS